MPVRTKSIVQFEQVYWATIILGIVSLFLGWDVMMQDVALQATVARFGMAMVYLPLVLGVALQLVLWYFIARRGSVIAKWVFVVLTALGLVWSAFTLLTRGTENALGGVLEVVQIVLQAIAIALLFRPDALAWFGEAVTPAAPPADTPLP